MANNKEEAGKGMPKPGEMSAAKRPYATIDLKATEVEGRDPAAGGGTKSSASAAATADAKSAGKPDDKAPERKAAEGRSKTCAICRRQRREGRPEGW